MKKNKITAQKNLKTLICFGVVLIMILGILTACGKEYGYEFHFDVDGGNGVLAPDKDIQRIWKCNEQPSHAFHTFECSESSQFAVLTGGKKGSHELTFIATPDDGFQVKEWLFNGEIVDSNKSNSYTAKVSSEQNYCGVISVKFEAVQGENNNQKGEIL